MNTNKYRSGMGLTILIILIALAGILLSGATVFFNNAMRQTQLRIDQTKAHTLAQAGVMRAIYDWTVSDASEENRRYAENAGGTTVTGNNLFKFALKSDDTPLQSDFAYYSFDLSETATWTTAGGLACTSGGVTDPCRRLQQFHVRNIHTSEDITPASCRISWEPDGGEKVTDIVVNNTSVYSDGTGTSSGVDIDITDATLTAGSAWTGTDTYFQWDIEPDSGSDVLVTVQWTFSDDSSTVDSKSHEVVYWNGAKPTGGEPAQHTFSVHSTGQVNQDVAGHFPVLKTVRAVVSGTPAVPEIVRWEERDKSVL